MKNKIFFVACETSADHHGAELIHILSKNRHDLEITGIGGPQMQRAGMHLYHDMTQIAALGFGDVIRKYPLYKRIFEDVVRRIEKEKPDLVVCLDSPAFNLRLAKRISKKVPIYYFIAPQLWAWGRRRIKVVQQHIRKMLVILPFEKKFYADYGVDSAFVGHPLMEKLRHVPDTAQCRAKLGLTSEKIHIGLFPGSRSKEVKRIFPVMLAAAKKIQAQIPHAVFHTNRAPSLAPALYDEELKKAGVGISFHNASFAETVRAMDFALIASGTATLEAALLGTPFFLLYKTGWSTYWLGRMLVKVNYLGLANLLLNKPVIPEFIQHDADPERIAEQAVQILQDPAQRKDMQAAFSELHGLLGNQSASETAAAEILTFLK